MSEYFALELTRANAQPLVCDTFAVILVLARGLHCVAEFVRAHVDPAAAQRAQHPLVSSAQLRPLGVDLHPAGREVSALPDENADLEEGRMAVDAHAVRVDLSGRVVRVPHRRGMATILLSVLRTRHGPLESPETQDSP